MVVREKQRCAIGHRRLERLRGNLPAGTGLVVHQHRRAQHVFEFLGQCAGNGIGAATGRKADHQLDGAGLGLGRRCKTQCTKRHNCGKVSCPGTARRVVRCMVHRCYSNKLSIDAKAVA